MNQKTLITISLFIALLLKTHQAISEEPKILKQEILTKQIDLKILTWNIFMLPHCSWINGNCERARAIAKEISKSDYDIVVFEEAFDNRARHILRKRLKHSFPNMYGPANNSFFSLRTSSGLWVISKIPLTKLKEIEYEHRIGIDAMARKGAVLFEGEWQGQLFQLIGTHLQADSPDSIRRKQCDEVADKLLNKYSKESIPQIVCGDFNIERNDDENYHYMLKAINAQNGTIEGDTQTSFDEIDNKLAKQKNGNKQLIDYVLVRNTSAIKTIRRRISVIRENYKNDFRDLSDHYGIEANITFNLSQVALSFLSTEENSKPNN